MVRLRLYFHLKQKLYKPFLRFDMYKQNDTSIPHLIRLNVFIPDFVEFLYPFIHDTKIILMSNSNAPPGVEILSSDKETHQKKNVYSKNGKILRASAARLKYLLSLASSTLLSQRS